MKQAKACYTDIPMETTTPPLPSRRAFFLQWTLANLVAWIVGMSLAYILSVLVEPLLQGFFLTLFWVVVGALVGFCFGVNHWIIFRPVRDRFAPGWHKRWFVGTVIGWSLSLSIVVGMDISQQLGYALSGLVIGLGVGLLQWPALQPKFRLAWVWLIGHPLSWFAGFAAIDLINPAIGFVLTGLLSGMLTGGLLIYLFDQQPAAAGNSA